jgi:CelD/BcsL family acetyltransferase involved in cellulose biosynthesis
MSGTSGLDLRRYDGDAEAWDELVEQANNGTIFHRLGFLAYHRERFAESVHHLAWTKGGILRAVMPLAILTEDGVRVARSPYGASYGGIVAGGALSLKLAEELVHSLIQHLREESVQKLVVVPPPIINLAKPTDYVEFWLLKSGAKCSAAELTSYIEVHEEPLEQFTYSAVKAVRKAKASEVSVEESADVEPFYEILVENRRKVGVTPTHSRGEIRWLLEELPEHVKLFMAYQGRTPIAGSLVFRVNRRVILDFYWAHRDEYQGLRPVSLLVYEITRWAHRQGFKLFDFGTQTKNMVPQEGSTRFKETFGALGVFRTTYELNLV